MDESGTPTAPGRSEGQWARPISALHVNGDGAGGDVAAVEGRELSGPMQGFGKMWQKTYRVRLEGADVKPAEVITAWKANFGDFWPKNARMYAPLAGITPGEVALISNKMPGGLTLSTGVYVIYSDETSFSYMNPAGHPWAGMITFSADEAEGVTTAQVHLLIRTFDPLTEIGMTLFGHRMEDNLWVHTLRGVASRFGVEDAAVTKVRVCVDRKRQWRNFRNWRRSSVIYGMTRPFRRKAKITTVEPASDAAVTATEESAGNS
jgi:hypothetical protein